MNAEKPKIILDIDASSDSALALVMAMLEPGIDLLGVCSVNGSAGVRTATDNSLLVAEACGRQSHVKIYKGCDLPLAATLTPWTPQATESRNREAADEHRLIPSRENPVIQSSAAKIKEEAISAVQFYLDTLTAAEDRSVTLVFTGPLTNIAVAMRADPRICRKIKEIMITGGGDRVNNISPAAEFNIWIDPEAAEILLQSGCRTTMISLDASHKIHLTSEEIQKIRALGTASATLSAGLIERRASSCNTEADLPAGYPVQSALAVCAVLHPEVLRDVTDSNVHVDIGGGYAYGQTVVDRRIRVVEEEHTCRFAANADRELYFSWLYTVLSNDKEHPHAGPCS